MRRDLRFPRSLHRGLERPNQTFLSEVRAQPVQEAVVLIPLEHPGCRNPRGTQPGPSSTPPLASRNMRGVCNSRDGSSTSVIPQAAEYHCKSTWLKKSLNEAPCSRQVRPPIRKGILLIPFWSKDQAWAREKKKNLVIIMKPEQ